MSLLWRALWLNRPSFRMLLKDVAGPLPSASETSSPGPEPLRPEKRARSPSPPPSPSSSQAGHKRARCASLPTVGIPNEGDAGAAAPYVLTPEAQVDSSPTTAAPTAALTFMDDIPPVCGWDGCEEEVTNWQDWHTHMAARHVSQNIAVWGHPARLPAASLSCPPVPNPNQAEPTTAPHPAVPYPHPAAPYPHPDVPYYYWYPAAPPHPHYVAPPHTLAHAPATTVAPVSHSFAATQPVASSPSPAAHPSSKALGKRKMVPEQPESDASADSEKKKTRGKRPRVETKVTCMWKGCGAKVVAADHGIHMRDIHFPGIGINQMKGRQVCQWDGCQEDPKTKNDYAGLNGVFKHLADVHFHARESQCDHCKIWKRNDALKLHLPICSERPSEVLEKENGV